MVLTVSRRGGDQAMAALGAARRFVLALRLTMFAAPARTGQWQTGGGQRGGRKRGPSVGSVGGKEAFS